MGLGILNLTAGAAADVAFKGEAYLRFEELLLEARAAAEGYDFVGADHLMQYLLWNHLNQFTIYLKFSFLGLSRFKDNGLKFLIQRRKYYSCMNVSSILIKYLKMEKLDEPGLDKTNSDWVQGYGYQMWMCRYGAFRADGAKGQYIIVLPESDAVIVLTSDSTLYQPYIDLVWKYLYPAIL